MGQEFNLSFFLIKKLESYEKDGSLKNDHRMLRFLSALKNGELKCPLLRETSGAFILVDAVLHGITGLGPENFEKWISPAEIYGINLLIKEFDKLS